MIKKQINRPINLSSDSIFQIIETYYSGRYKTSRKSDSKLNIKRLYKFQSNGWETIMKRLNFNDSACFVILETTIKFEINLWKELMFSALFLVLGLLFAWKVWTLTFILSFLLISIPIVFIWLIGIVDLINFMNTEIVELTKRIND